MKISVIVPIYNVSKYIEKCLDSLVNQTLSDIEIILVNDGSKENEEELIKPYLDKYKNIKYLKKENAGLSSARNMGIKYASGEYIAFLDSDDYVDLNMYHEMYQKAKEKDYDLVLCDINYVYPDKIKKESSGIDKDTNNIKEIMLTIHPAAWNKIFKKDLFKNKIYFKEGIWFEDVEFLYRMLPFIKTIGVINKPFIQYIQRENSITHTKSNKIDDYLSNFEGLIKFYKENKFYNEYQKELEYVFVRYIYATYIKQSLMYDYENYRESVLKAIKLVSRNFPNYKKNKHFYKSLKGLYLLSFNKTVANLLYKIKR